MSNHIADHAMAWHLLHPEARQTLTLLYPAPIKVSNILINNFPNLSDNDKKDLREKVKGSRDKILSLLQAKKELLESYWKIFISKGEDFMKNVWKDTDVFRTYYRCWKGAMITLGIPIEQLPNWPPQDYNPVADPEFETSIKEDALALRDADPSIKGKKINFPSPKASFPDNMDAKKFAQAHNWVLTTYFRYGPTEFEPIANQLIAHTGIKLFYSFIDRMIIYSWLNDEKFAEAEEEFIRTNKRISESFKTRLEQEGDSLPEWMEQLEKLASEFIVEETEEEKEEKEEEVKDPKGDSSEKGEGSAEGSGPKNDEGKGDKDEEAKGDGDKDNKDDKGKKKVEEGKDSEEQGKRDKLMSDAFNSSFRKFDKDKRSIEPVEQDIDDFLSEPSPAYIKLVDDRFILRNRGYDVDSIRIFISDNELDEEDTDDASFAAIVVKLISVKAILPNTFEGKDPTPPPKPVAKSAVNEARMKVWARSARRMVDAAFAFASQGTKDGDLSWYESYCNVYGKLMRNRRFVQVCELIVVSGFLSSYTKKLTVGEVRSQNNVTNYRFMRLSTPTMVLKAVAKVENEKIYRWINPIPLMEYVKFERAGVLAQIASGPLKIYCKGDVDVMTTEDIPSDLRISELKAMESAPYDSKLIRQAYIIHMIYESLPPKWYQGEKAYADADAKDSIFHFVVKAYKRSERDAAQRLVGDEVEIEEKDVMGDVNQYYDVVAVMKKRSAS